RTLARELGIRVLTPSSLDVNDDQVVGFLKDTQTDVALIFGCDQILRQKLIATTPLVVNYHNSLLPKYRGVGATVWPFLHGEVESGFSYHTIDDEKIDVGRLVLQSKVPMPPLAEAHSYSDRLNEAAARALPALITTLTTRGDFARLPPTEEYF